MSTTLTWRFRASAAVAAALVLATFAAVAMRPPAVGPHMSPHLSYIEGPDAADISPDANHRDCVFNIARFGFIPCYGPYDLGKIYNFPSNLDGTGQTIVIVDAYGSPFIRPDLAAFDGYFGVQAPPTFKVINVPGTGVTGSGATDSWAVETSLDVEYAHAMAPGANIVLAVAATDNNFDMNAAEAAVLPLYPGAIVSQSFGDFETDSSAGDSFAQQHTILMDASRMGDTLLASTGDFGATWTPVTHATSPVLASYPASDPLVTAVGGTMGKPYPGGLLVNGAYGDESAWNEPRLGGATGGAPSVLFKAPSWQRGDTDFKARTIPDVAYNAAIEGGVEVFRSLLVAGKVVHRINLVGGTSAGTPQWAAIFALANQSRNAIGHDNLGFANRSLYQQAEKQMHGNGPAVFHDVTTGNNALGSTTGFSAAPGYDLATGWGTPDVSALVDALVGPSADRNPEANEPHGTGNGDNGAGTGTMAPSI